MHIPEGKLERKKSKRRFGKGGDFSGCAVLPMSENNQAQFRSDHLYSIVFLESRLNNQEKLRQQLFLNYFHQKKRAPENVGHIKGQVIPRALIEPKGGKFISCEPSEEGGEKRIPPALNG